MNGQAHIRTQNPFESIFMKRAKMFSFDDYFLLCSFEKKKKKSDLIKIY